MSGQEHTPTGRERGAASSAVCMSRKEIIDRLIKERGIEKLIHFTDARNVPSIKKHGLLSVSQLRSRGMPYCFNDPQRFDGKEDYISLSISSCNKFLLDVFDKKKEDCSWSAHGGPVEEPRTGEKDKKFMALEIKPEVIGDKMCMFYDTNASNGKFLGGLIACESLNSFVGMFSNKVENKNGTVERTAHRPCRTTCVQAEVMVKDQIESKYIIGWREINDS